MFITSQDADLGEFKKLCEGKTLLSDYPQAQEVQDNVVFYHGDHLREISERIGLLNELHRALGDGPGVVVIRQFYSDPALIDRGTEIFNRIIIQESEKGGKGDHFAQDTPNARVWNVVEKLLDTDPQYFYDYFKNPLLPLVAEAWLGPAYQVTAQVNLVRPGNKAQVAHRDYHLGFLNDEVIWSYPLKAQVISQYLTLQGAVAHCDMPIESGPTLLLPHSQKFSLGYSAMRRPDFIEYFNQKAVQCELKKGDAIFFSPALFHAAGDNRSADIERMANLLQISSSFGRPMEKVNWVHTAEKIYPVLLEKINSFSQLTEEMEAVIKTAAQGYPFPSNLDVMKPKPGSLTPMSDQELIHIHLREKKPLKTFIHSLRENQV